MKKIIVFVFVLCAATLGAVYSRTTGLGPTLARLPAAGSQEFSRLTYRLYLFGLVPVGEACLIQNGIEELDGRRVIHLSGSGRTAPYLSSLITGAFSADSYIDSAALAPRLFIQSLRVSGKADKVSQIVYDQEGGTMTIGSEQREIPTGVQDPLSALYKLTRTDFDTAGTISMDLNSNQKTYALTGTAARARRKAGEGAVITVNARISRKDKNPYHTSRMSFVLSDLHAHVPVLIKVFAGGVFVTAQLTDFQ